MPASYEVLGESAGRRYFAHVRNLIVHPLSRADFFVEPWDSLDVRDRSLFDATPGRSAHAVLILSTDDEALAALLRSESDVYVYGAYNQVTVCQMRARAVVEECKDDVEIAEYTQLLRRKLVGGTSVDPLKRDLYDDDRAKRLAQIERAPVFRMTITEYAYAVYERG